MYIYIYIYLYIYLLRTTFRYQSTSLLAKESESSHFLIAGVLIWGAPKKLYILDNIQDFAG